MSDNGIVLRFGRIKSRRQLFDAFKHNYREFINLDSNIDALKTPLNLSLVEGSTSAESMAKFEKILQESGIKKLRRNAVLAVEVLISIQPNLDEDKLHDFFCECGEWVISYFRVPYISMNIHLDESNPHIHVILVPILVQGKLNGNKMIGDIKKIRLAQKSLYETVGKRFGLSNWGSDKQNKKELTNKILEGLKNDIVLKSVKWPAILKAIKKNPQNFSELLS